MTRLQTTLFIGLTMLVSSTSAFAQHHHVPSLSGSYTDKNTNTEQCTITQDGTSLRITCITPGVSTFVFSGTYGMGEHLLDDGRVVRVYGYHGTGNVTFHQTQQSLSGAVGVYHHSSTGNVEIISFREQNGHWKRFNSVILCPVGTLASRPVTSPNKNTTLSETPDEFQLLPVDDLRSLGL